MPRQQMLTLSHSDLYSTFDPDTMAKLHQVVEDAWRELVRRGDPVAKPRNEQIVRELLAHRVMSRARQEGFDADRLREHALWGFSH